MFRRYPWRVYFTAVAVMTLAHFVLAFILREEIALAYNAVSLLPWILTTYVSGPACAGSAVITLWNHRADKNSISQTSPRSKVAIGLVDSLIRYITLVVIPFALVYGGALVYSALSSNRGFLDLRHVAPALILLAAVVLVGEFVARVLVRKELFAILLAFIIGIIIGLYSIYTGSSQHSWTQANPDVYSLVLPLFAIALGAKLVGEILKPERFKWPRRALLVALCAAFVMLFHSSSPENATIERTATIEDFTCVDVGQDLLCVWNESDYKIPALATQIERGTLLADKLGLTTEPILFYEQGFEAVGSDPRFSRWEVDPYSSFAAFGPEENSWAAAQGIALFYQDRFVHGAGCIGGDDYDWLLGDLATNYVYGDITFGDYSSGNPENDRTVQEIAKKWASFTDDQIASELAQLHSEYVSTCETKELS